MNITIRLKGGPEMAAKLRKLGDAAAGQVLENAVTAGALLILEAAVKKTPYKTGNLRRSEHVGGRLVDSKKANPNVFTDTTGTDVGGNEHSRTRAKVLVGTNVEYAKPVEYGTGRMPARPYLRPAFDEQKEAAAREIGAALWKLLKTAAR